MFFLGFNFLGADELTCPITPTIQTDNTSVELSSVKADILAVTKDVEFTPTEEVNNVWDFNTIFIAEFNGDTHAGNVNWVLDNVSHIAVKRRVVGDYNWITIAVKEVDGKYENLNIGGTDITCESLEYEYAIVPMNNKIEGAYSMVTVDVTNEDLVVIDKTGIYHTPLTDGYCDVVDVHPNSVLELLHNRYPTVVRNTLANYETITVEGDFLPFDDNNCINLDVLNDVDGRNDRKRVLYRREVKEFLTNGLLKILKNVDGQCWLVYVTTPPSDTADNYYNVRKLSFGCTETGNLKSEHDLYYAGLLDVDEEYWSGSY